MTLLRFIVIALEVAALIALNACTTIPKAAPVIRPAAQTMTASTPTWITETWLPDAWHIQHETLYHEGQTIPGVPEEEPVVVLNGTVLR